MGAGRVFKLIAEAIGTVLLSAFAIYAQEEFAKGFIDSVRKEK